jgi:hypothetical protein
LEQRLAGADPDDDFLDEVSVRRRREPESERYEDPDDEGGRPRRRKRGLVEEFFDFG